VIAAITLPWGRRLGGAEEMVWMLLRHRDRSRLEPRVIFLEPGPFEREVASEGIATHVVDAGRLRQAGAFVRATQAVRRIVDGERADVLVNWSPKTQLYGSSTARPTVWWQHGVPNGHWLDRVATALPARAVGCSSHASAAAQDRLRPRRETFVVHPGIELPTSREAGDRRAVLAELGIPTDRLVVGIVGRLQPWKGQHHFLRALALLVADGLPVHGLVVGGDAYELSPAYAASLRGLIHELGVESAVTMTGQVADASRLIAGMDALVNASDPEPFGIVLLEAMGRGVPTVAVGSAGPSEIVEDERSGLLLPAAEPRLIAHAVRRIAEEPELAARLRDRGRERVATSFSAEAMAGRFQDALERIVGADGG
jgi:glycosyltransferase involved in cell wall biosynthesis